MDAFEKARKLTAELKATPIEDQHAYDRFNKKVDASLRDLNALYTNPADRDEAKTIKRDLLDAWGRLAIA